MIISHKKKFIFIHNYKVAGTSIRRALKSYSNNSFVESSLIDKVKILMGIYPNIYSKQVKGHINISELKVQIPSKIFNEYYKFGFARNPWDWQVSLYTFMLKQEGHHQHKLIKSMKDFDEYIDWRVHNDLHLQKDFFYDNNEVCLMDFIGKIENLNSDFSKICDRLNIDSKLTHLNSSRTEKDKFIGYYSQKSIDMVYDAFKEDVILFGYTKPEIVKH